MEKRRPCLYYEEIQLGNKGKNVQYTCIDASDHFLVCGSNTGSVYIFVRQNGLSPNLPYQQIHPRTSVIMGQYQLVKMIAPPRSDRVAVSSVCICPKQQYLAVGSARGAVYAVSLAELKRVGEKTVFSYDDHKGFPVSTMIWDDTGTRLFTGCNSGIVVMTNIRVGMSALFGSAYSELLLQEDSGISQMDFCKYNTSEILLVSSQTRVLLLELNAQQGNAIQIGTKPRQGNYGACSFITRGESVNPAPQLPFKIFSVRPGKRLWVADHETGRVLSTLKFPLNSPASTFEPATNIRAQTPAATRPPNFTKVNLFQFYPTRDSEQAMPTPELVGWSTNGSGLFYIDPVNVKIVEWHLDLGEIHDLKVLKHDLNRMFILHGDQKKVSVVHACSPKIFFKLIMDKKDAQACVEAALSYQLQDIPLLEKLRLDWIDSLEKQRKNETAKLLSQFDEWIEVCKQDETNISSAQPLDAVQSFPSPPRSPLAARPDDLDAIQHVVLPNQLHKTQQFEFAEMPTAVESEFQRIYAAKPNVRFADIPELDEADPVIDPLLVVDDPEDSESSALSTNPSFSEEIFGGQFDYHFSQLRTSFSARAVAYIPATASILKTTSSETKREDSDPDFSLQLVDRRRVIETTPLLRTAMSVDIAGGESEVEAMMEAIALHLWENNGKYIAGVPRRQVSRLAEIEEEEEEILELKATNHINKQKQEEQKPAIEVADLVKQFQPSRLHRRQLSEVGTGNSPPRIQRRHSSLGNVNPIEGPVELINPSDTTGRVEFKSILLCPFSIVAPDLQPVFERDVEELKTQLRVAHAAALKEPKLVQSLWPASGITRVASALVHIGLHHGNLKEVELTIDKWLRCFNPNPNAVEESPTISDKLDDLEGWKRGGKIIAGDGLPLQRRDWELVRSMVTLYFQCHVGGEYLFIRTDSRARGDADAPTHGALCSQHNRSYVEIVKDQMETGPRSPRVNPEQQIAEVSVELRAIPSSMYCNAFDKWDADHTLEFLEAYRMYLYPDLAAEVCNGRQYAQALEKVLDLTLKNSNVVDKCDEIVNFVAEGNTQAAIQELSNPYNEACLCILLHLLDLLLKKSPEQTIALCVSRYPSIRSWNIERSLFGNNEMPTESIPTCRMSSVAASYRAYYSYLLLLLDTRPEARRNHKLVEAWVQLGLSLLESPTCPLEMEATSNRLKDRPWLNIFHVHDENEAYHYDPGALWNFCLENGHVYELIELALRAGFERECCSGEYVCDACQLVFDRISRVFDVITAKLASDYEQDLVSRSRFAYLLHRLVEKQKDERCINHVIALFDGLCRSWASNAVSGHILHVLIQIFGFQRTLLFCQKYSGLLVGVELTFFQSLIAIEELTLQQQETCMEFLRTVDTFTWSRAANSGTLTPLECFSPQLQAIVQFELNQDTPEIVRSPPKPLTFSTKAKASPIERLPGSRQTRDNQCRPFFESEQNAWGRVVSMDHLLCEHCDLTVLNPEEDGVEAGGRARGNEWDGVVLRCGHVYHVTCLPDPSSCTCCLVKTMDSILFSN